MIKFSQNTWLKSNIDINTNLTQKAKNNFEKGLFKLLNNAVFGKTMESVRKRRNIKLITRKRKRNYLLFTIIYYLLFFTENVLATKMRKTQILMNKPGYLGLSISDLSKPTMYEFRYDYVKPICGENVKLCYMETDSLIVYAKTEDLYKRCCRRC